MGGREGRKEGRKGEVREGGREGVVPVLSCVIVCCVILHKFSFLNNREMAL